MKASYIDIRNKIQEEPQWYDSNGVPRYEKFSVNLCPDIYADEIVLLEISCQSCYKKFLVEMHWSVIDAVYLKYSRKISESFDEWIKNDKAGMPIHYGDPPIHCCVGDTMNCYDLRVLEFWKKNSFDWKRIKEFEVELEKEHE